MEHCAGGVGMSQGKGSASRPMSVSPDVYRNSYNRIFRKTPEPPPPSPEVVMLCPACNGDGRVDRSCSRHSGCACDCEVRPSTETCDQCNGEGTIEGPDADI
jgi:hypothetical protein